MPSTVSAEDAQQAFISVCCGVSLTTLLVYEYLITFDREFQLVWKRRFSAATLVFLSIRYTLLLNFIIIIPTIYPLTTKSCSALGWMVMVLQVLFRFLSAAFSSLRAYVLSGRRWQIVPLIFILAMVPFAVQLFTNVRQVAVVAPPPINCTTVYLISAALANTLTYVARSVAIAVDILVIALTIHQTHQTIRIAMEANLRTPLYSLVLRDGTLYFATLLIMNVVDMISIYLGETHNSFSYLSEFIDPITAVLISRFMLNLREIDPSRSGSEDPNVPSFSVHSMRFATFVEPLGAPLDHEVSFSTTDFSSSEERGINAGIGHEDGLGDNDEMI